ncbi:MAG TPA: vitamin K epoxide reductase family protein [Solirubrobacteraceae bacterium]|nr:vitamin K epoxide reductase family protein [Solirubrobacteraceae bacterium]
MAPAQRAPARGVGGGRDRLMVAILVVTTLGFLDAAYLTYVHYAGFGALACFGAHSGHSSCETVQSSQWSEIVGIPVALLGLLGYVGLFVSYWVAARLDGELGRGMSFGIALIGFGFSLYLTYRELFSIHAICEWCVGSAVCLTVLTVLTAVRFLRGGAPSGARPG